MTTNDYARVEQAIRYLDEHFQNQPTLRDVAAAVGLSEHHFQRLFRRWAGISPKRFLQHLTSQYTGGLLRRATPLLDAAYDAGLSGTGRLHELYVTLHAMTPAQYRAHGAGLTIRHGFQPSPFGECLIGLTDNGICWLSFVAKQRQTAYREFEREWHNARLIEDTARTADIARRVFSPDTPHAGPLMLNLRGTNFQIRVWEALLRIPLGTAVRYADVARQIGVPTASRAVGAAVGANPIAYLIPCHRVIRSTGAVGDYRWGAARKRAMLAWEASNALRPVRRDPSATQRGQPGACR